jgi:phospholipase C
MAIKHVIVVMFENRSYDNVLGALYGPSNPPGYTVPPPGQTSLNGIPSDATNPSTTGGPPIKVHNQTNPTQIGGSGPAYAPTSIPLVDPKEYFKDMAQQILGLTSIPDSAPYVNYPPPGASAMNGFTLNYAEEPGVGQSAVPAENVPDIMNYFTPAQLPVSAFLAKNYAVCDEWFASAPTQTFTNRAFAFCAAPGVTSDVFGNPYSLIDDVQYFDVEKNPITLQMLDSVASTLDNLPGASGPAWKVYFHDYSIAADTVQYVKVKGATTANINVSTFDNGDWPAGIPPQLGATTSTFVDDLRNDKLPQFSWIEPRYNDNVAPTRLPPNSNHPGTAFGLLGGSGAKAPIDFASGELFLMQLYNMLRASSKWEEMLLIVVYDEHGGTYDHVLPVGAAAPGRGIPSVDSLSDSAASGFNFTLLGGRVPAIIVSSAITSGEAIRSSTATKFDHSSIVRTVLDIFVPPPGSTSLTDRDQNAPSLVSSLGATGNPTDLYGGRILCGPMSLSFASDNLVPQYLLASAGPTIGLSATAQPSWLSFGATGTSMPTSLMLYVTVDPSRATAGVNEGTITLSAVGATATNSPLTIPVTLFKN